MTVSMFGPVVLVGLIPVSIGPTLLEMTRHRTADTNTRSDSRRRMR
ncbi:MAG: hypothetical protein ACLPVY_24550 [Acidimicrobiia bacterium]